MPDSPHYRPIDGQSPTGGISKPVYDDLVRYTKYSSGAYHVLCARPMGNKLVLHFTDLTNSTGTQGFIARDDTRKEIIVAFRGSQQIAHALMDTQILLVPLKVPGMMDAGDARVHAGFLLSYDSVALEIIPVVKLQLDAHPGYTIIATGHSLGGAVASIAAVSLKASFPQSPVNLYTFGQPRTGNESYAALIEELLSAQNIYRAVHSYDGVPTLIPRKFGYYHHATEYWQFAEPPKPENVKRCEGGEDPDGSASIPSGGINLPHMVYFGHAVSLDPTVCI